LNQPLLFDTDGIGNPDDATVRRAAWTAWVSGGHVSYLDDSLQPGSEHGGDFQGSLRATLREQLGHLAAFARPMRFWEMQPDDTLVVGSGRRTVPAFALASAHEAVVYLPHGGSVTLNLAGLQGPLTARWFNPREGKWAEEFALEGAGDREFTAPAAEDWTLYLRRSCP
jgi:hypothetical protein